jgi:NAD(P)-dependent dehydrogenase (short-subunit alcohol dehydrogenase family)
MRWSTIFSLTVLAHAVFFAVVTRQSDFYNPTFPVCDVEKSKCSVLVTGASQGIGKAIVEELAAKGFHVYAAMRREADFLSGLKNVVNIILDVNNATQVDEVKSLDLWALVNNAGVGSDGVLEADQIWERTLQTNLVAPLRLTKTVLPQMRSLSRGGRIVNIGSVQSELAIPGSMAYVASKFGLRGFTHSLRREVSGFGIHASLIQPGFVATRMAEGLLPQFQAKKDLIGKDPVITAYAKFYDEKFIKEFQETYEATIGKMEEVVADVLHAVQSPRPHNVYTESVIKFLLPIVNVLPTIVVDKMLKK